MSTVHVDVSGAMVCWYPADCLQQAARNAFLAAGFGELAPKPRTDYEALREALGELKGKDELVQRHRAHEKHGCELVSVQRGEDENVYNRQFGVKVRAGYVIVDDASCINADNLQRLYEDAKTKVSAWAISVCLLEVVRSLTGVRIRENGALYWVPEESVPRLEVLADALATAGAANLMVLRTALDERAARHVTEGLTREVMKQCEAICEEVATLGTQEAIERRKMKAFEMRCLVERYSTILKDGLEGLKRAIGLAETAAVMAAMQAVAA